MKKEWIQKLITVSLSIVVCLSISSCSSKQTIQPQTQPNTPSQTNSTQEVTSPWGGLTYTGSGVGYVIKFENGVKFYDSGDTNLFYDMKAVIGDYYKPDVAFLSIGNYFTMDDGLAAKATEWINPKIVIPQHYGSYPMLSPNPDKFVKLVQQSKQKGLTRAEPKVLTPGKEENILGIKTLWLGHATVRLTSPTGIVIYIDPWLETNPSCPAEYKKLENLKKPDIILFTHGHVDHVNLDEVEKIAKEFNPVIIAQWELGLYLQQKLSCPVILANKGGTISQNNILLQGSIKDNRKVMPEGMEISLVSADHTSSK